MARRVLKPLTPLLVGLVAVVLGFLAIGPSFADTDRPVPSSVHLAPATPDSVAPHRRTGFRGSAPPPRRRPGLRSPRKAVDPGPILCASCMAPPGS